MVPTRSFTRSSGFPSRHSVTFPSASYAAGIMGTDCGSSMLWVYATIRSRTPAALSVTHCCLAALSSALKVVTPRLKVGRLNLSVGEEATGAGSGAGAVGAGTRVAAGAGAGDVGALRAGVGAAGSEELDADTSVGSEEEEVCRSFFSVKFLL